MIIFLGLRVMIHAILKQSCSLGEVEEGTSAVIQIF